MAMINYAVYSESSRRMLLSWRIASVNPPSSTFRSFFSVQVQDLCERSDEQSEVFVGQAKDHLDLVDPDLVIAEVVAVLGRFVKYTDEKEEVGL